MAVLAESDAVLYPAIFHTLPKASKFVPHPYRLAQRYHA
jgi:hypothetical protein